MPTSRASIPSLGYIDHRVGSSVFTVHPRYRDLRPVGRGAYGLVCSALDAWTGGRQVAIKKIGKVFADLIDAKRIMREVKLLRHFARGSTPHENIIDVLDIMTSPPDCRDFEDLYIVMELFEADLTRILASKQPLTDEHAIYFIYQLLRGLKFIHSAGVLHRDIKPSNLLVNSNCDLAIADLGLSRGITFDPMSEEELTRYVQTRWYRAPELLCQATKYDTPMDIWSVGCILGEILVRKPILQGNSSANELTLVVELVGTPSDQDLADCHASDEAVRFIHHLAVIDQAHIRFPQLFGPTTTTTSPTPLNPLAVDLLQRMLVFNPTKRITIEEAMQHPFFADLHARAPEAPVCHSPFDYRFESQWPPGTGTSIPKSALQDLIFEELVELRKEQSGVRSVGGTTVEEAPPPPTTTSTSTSSSSSSSTSSSTTTTEGGGAHHTQSSSVTVGMGAGSG